MCVCGIPRPSLHQYLTTVADVRAECRRHGMPPDVIDALCPETLDYWIARGYSAAEIYAICVNRPVRES